MITSDYRTSKASLEPQSILVYLGMIIASVLISVASCLGIAFFFFLYYKDWCKNMHEYGDTTVQTNEFPSKIDFVDNDLSKPLPIMVENLADDSDEEKIEVKKEKTRKGPTIRLTKVKVPNEDNTNNENVELIEIEPTKFVEKIKKKDKHLRNPGPDKELGRLSFRIEYHETNNELRITQIYGEGLRKKNSQAILNPFIVIYIWPDNAWPIKTVVKKKTNSARWDETVIYENFDIHLMFNNALHFKIQTWQQFKPNEIIGHVVLPLRVIKNCTNGLFEEHFVKNLQPDLQINRGAIKLVFVYHESDNIEGEIIVTILKANLVYPVGFISDQCQVFVKVAVIHPAQQILTKFTSIQRGSFEPRWNENLSFKILRENVSKLSVIISIREEGFSKEGKLFAFVELGPEHSESNNTHLRTIIKNPNILVTQWHQLISNIP